MRLFSIFRGLNDEFGIKKVSAKPEGLKFKWWGSVLILFLGDFYFGLWKFHFLDWSSNH